MRDILRLLAIVTVTGTALPVMAQEATGEVAQAPEAQAPAETTQGEARPQAYVKETHSDWRIVCLKVSDDRETCTMQQLMRDGEGNAVSQVSIAPLPAAAAPRVALVEVATPLETLLSEDLRVGIDTSEPKVYRFSYCTPQACVARFALTAGDVAAYKAGGEAKVIITPLVAPDQLATITMSLSGFTASYDALTKILAQ